MRAQKERKPLFERLRTGLEEAIRHTRGEITLRTTVCELPDPPPEVMAQELTRLRLNHQMSQAFFARLLNVSTKTVQSWEHGTRRPSQATLRLIQVLRQNPSVLFQVVGIPLCQTATHRANKQTRGSSVQSTATARRKRKKQAV